MKNDGIPHIFDQARLAHAKRRAARMDSDHKFLVHEIGDRLLERLGEVNRDFSDIYLFGNNFGNNFSSGNTLPVAHTVANDYPAEILNCAPASADLILSNLTLHWINDLPGMLVQINRALKPDGLFLASLFGGDTLHELRHSFIAAEAEIKGGASPRVSPFADVRDLGSLLQRAGFALPVTDSDTLTVTYDHPLKLLHDLRGMGETNSLVDRSRTTLRRDVVVRACEIYSQTFGLPDGRVPATFQILYMTGWHPHESQQKPLKPGSGKVNLRDVLTPGK